MMPSEVWSQYLTHYGYVALFLLSFVEGPIVTILAAFLASQGLLSVTAVYLTVVLGDIGGDGLYYAMGRWFLRRLPWFIGRRGPSLRRRVERIGVRLRSQPGRALLFGKFTHSTGFVILLAAGAARVPLGIFFVYSVAGTLPKSALLVLIGYFYGEFFKTLSRGLQISTMILFVLLAGLILYISHRWSLPRDESRESE